MALITVLGLIGAGFAMRARKFLTPEFWPQAEKLCYYVLLPALFVHGTANAELCHLPIGAMAPVLAGSVVLSATALVLVQSRLSFNGPAFTSVVQGSIQFNNYLGLSIAVVLYREQGVAGSASLPVGLLCVGAALKISSIGRNFPPIAYASAVRFLVLPGIAAAACVLIGLAGPPAGIIVLFLALPTASSAYVMAQALGGDSTLMASTVTLQTIAGIVYLPCLLLLITSFSG